MARQIEVRRVGPDESFYASDFPGGVPVGMRWVAVTHDHRHFPGLTRERALKRARRYLRDLERADASRSVVEA